MDAASAPTGIESVLARNRAFATASGHEGATLFPTLGLIVVTCLDARVDPAHILGLELGDALVVRNNGGRVTPQLIDDLAYVSQLAEAARGRPAVRGRRDPAHPVRRRPARRQCVPWPVR
jgi:hypothetical protein